MENEMAFEAFLVILFWFSVILLGIVGIEKFLTKTRAGMRVEEFLASLEPTNKEDDK